MPKYAMVIDLQRCVGCGACSIACRNENNVPDGIYWSSKITETSGTFPNVRFHYLPTLCNHCSDAPCVKGCPTKAMHKLDNGITMHDPDKCIGCRYCQYNCPYEVIYFNWQDPHKFWKDPGRSSRVARVSPKKWPRRSTTEMERPIAIRKGRKRFRRQDPRAWLKSAPFATTESRRARYLTVWRPVPRMPGYLGIWTSRTAR